jgi:VWFA-related protein
MSTLGLLVLSAVTLAPLVAQEPDTEAPIKVEVSVVSVLASVRNKQGALVGNLAKDDFLLSEDGKPQTIKYFTRETDLPLTIGLLVDVSASQERLIDIEKDAASQFFTHMLRQKDMAFLISFGEECELLQDYTNSARLLRGGLTGLKVNAPVGTLSRMPGPVPTVYQPRGTVLYDAVFLAADEKLKGQVGRKVLVLITDGVDEGSRLKLEDALRAAQKADAVVYSIDYSDPGAYGGRGFGLGMGGAGESALKRMSEPTGGQVFRVDRKHPLDEVFHEIQEEMRSQYAIGYTPINGVRDGSFRRIELRTSNKDLKVQARKGYYASKPEE